MTTNTAQNLQPYQIPFPAEHDALPTLQVVSFDDLADFEAVCMEQRTNGSNRAHVFFTRRGKLAKVTFTQMIDSGVPSDVRGDPLVRGLKSLATEADYATRIAGLKRLAGLARVLRYEGGQVEDWLTPEKSKDVSDAAERELNSYRLYRKNQQ